jgi:hypothetical protein
MQYQIVLNFTSLEELTEFNKQYAKFQSKKTEKPENDNRGSKTKEIHQKAKVLHDENPEISYRDCFIKISKNLA